MASSSNTVMGAGGAQSMPAAELEHAHEMISSRRVEGTSVFDRDGRKLGTIHSMMIGKRSGRVGYALMEFGGVLGVGSHVHPIPWDSLTYDVDRDGYSVDMTREQLQRAPRMSLDDTDRPIDREHAEEVRSYYGALPWWGL
jgi:sporulation protein YlmC with PRC-barrel domain